MVQKVFVRPLRWGLLLWRLTKVTPSGADGYKFLLPFNHRGTTYKLKFTRLFWIGSRAPQATPLRILLLYCSFVGKSFFFAESRDLKSSYYMLLQRKLIPTRRSCLQMKAASEGKMGSAQLNCRRNGSEMRLFPRKAVILIPSCAVPKKSFWLLLWRLTKVTPSGADGYKPFAPFTHKGTAYKLKFTRLF